MVTAVDTVSQSMADAVGKSRLTTTRENDFARLKQKTRCLK